MQVYLNGRILPITEARISPLDRGFIFGDGVYEGLYAVPDRRVGGNATRIVGLQRHIQRLAASMRALDLAGWDPANLGDIAAEVCRVNNLTSAFVYFQITRGAPAAAYGGPGPVRERVPEGPVGAVGDARGPCLFAFATPFPAPETFTEPRCRTAALRDDHRWRLGHIKSISLAGNVLAALDAHRAGAEDAILVRRGVNGKDDLVTESLAANVIVVTETGEVVTPSLDSVPILAGVTRAILLEHAPTLNERPVHAAELPTAREIMICGTTTLVTAITHLDGRPVDGGREAGGEGGAGPVARQLLQTLITTILESRDDPA